MSTKYKKQKDGRYMAAVWDGTYNADGTKHRKYLTSRKSSKDLEKRVKEFERAVAERTAVVKNHMTFQQYARKWRDVYKAGTAGNTLAMYDNVIRNTLQWKELYSSRTSGLCMPSASSEPRKERSGLNSRSA